MNTIESAHLAQSCKFRSATKRFVECSRGAQLLWNADVYVGYSCWVGKGRHKAGRDNEAELFQKSAPPAGGAQRRQKAEELERTIKFSPCICTGEYQSGIN